jgi:L-methionine (R)-S-oxide reductase
VFGHELVKQVEHIISRSHDRGTSLQAVADTIRQSGNYRWVGLYDVDHAAGIIKNIVWSGPGAPAHPAFPINKGLTGVAVAERRTVNVGDVAADPRYLTAFGSTKSEIIVPIFDGGRRMIGSIDIESELPNAFGPEVQAILERCADVIAALWH